MFGISNDMAIYRSRYRHGEIWR